MLKKLLKKIKCRLFFCFGSRCSYNEHGNGKLNVEFNEENILSNFSISFFLLLFLAIIVYLLQSYKKNTNLFFSLKYFSFFLL